MAYVGIVTRYYQHEAAYLALRIADWFHFRGHDVSLLATEANPTALGSSWDQNVSFCPPRYFTAWSSHANVLIWTHAPFPEQVTWASRNKIRTIVVPLWQELRSEDRKALRKADFVVSPTTAAAAMLQERWNLSNVRVAPWCPGLPVTQKQSLRDEYWLHVAVSLLDIYDPEILEPYIASLASVIDNTTWLRVTLLYLPSRLFPRTKRRLQNLAKKYSGQLVLKPKPRVLDQPLIMQQNDLAVCPTWAENSGRVCLMALAAGTPVITYRHPVPDEFVTLDNGVRMPADLYPNNLGVPVVLPDYDYFAQVLTGLDGVPGRTLAKQLQAGTHVGLVSRSSVFDGTWREAAEGL